MPDPTTFTRYARGFALVMDFVGMIGAGALIGWLVDRRYGTGPYGVLGLMVIGVAGGFVRLVTELRRLDRADADR